MDRTDNNTALCTLYARYQTELCRYLVTKVGVTHDEAEDIVQIAFARIAGKNFDAIENHRAFLYKSCHNIAIDSKRHSRVRQRYVEGVRHSSSAAVEELGPERYLESARKMNQIKSALRRMTRKRRQIIIMSRIEGLSNAEIARQLGLSETVIRRHILKALAVCQEAINAESE